MTLGPSIRGSASGSVLPPPTRWVFPLGHRLVRRATPPGHSSITSGRYGGAGRRSDGPPSRHSRTGRWRRRRRRPAVRTSRLPGNAPPPLPTKVGRWLGRWLPKPPTDEPPPLDSPSGTHF